MRFVHKNGLNQVLVILRITQAPVEHRDRKHGFCDRTLQHVIPASPSIENAAFHKQGVDKNTSIGVGQPERRKRSVQT